MSVAPDQLGEIYRKIRECFFSHPVISVDPTQGDPPDQYEITYNINGMSKTEGGEVLESTGHTIELAIPFGFPHFPPSCKPKSAIFHPDFDPAAICLGDFWHQDRALTELIIRIGKMINGEIYSTTNAFNEDAAAWYLANSNKLPLAAIDWRTDPGAGFAFDGSGREIDTLDDADLRSDFNFRTLEENGTGEEITLGTSFPEIAGAPNEGSELLYLLDSQRKYYKLLEKALDTTSSSEEINGLTKTARYKIKKAKELHREAKKLENLGNAQKSLEMYQQVATAVTDFPAIGSDIRRITQTLALLEDMAVDDFQDLDKPPSLEVDEEFAAVNNIASKTAAKTKKVTLQARNDAFFNNKGARSKIPLYLLLALLGSAMGCGGYFWYSFKHNLKEAEEGLSHCSTALESAQFDDAKRSCEKALQSAEGVNFIQQDRVRQLQNSIREILQSEKLSQGLAGKILLDGRYLPINEAQTVQSMKMLLAEAEALYVEEKWQPALELYKKLQLQAEKTGYLNQKVVDEINHKRLISEFRIPYDSAQVPMQKGQWQEAAAELIKAQNILETMPETDRGQYFEQLQYAIQKCRSEDFKTQGDLFFSKSDWPNAISGYNLALSSAQDKGSLSPEIIDTIKKNLRRAMLYTTINKGNVAFGSGAWEKAIEAYDEASVFLSTNQDILSRTEAEANQLKLLRIILQASIIRDRQTVKAQLENKELTGVRTSYQHILSQIAKSSFADEEEFVATRKEITSALKALDTEIFLAEKEDYLKSNYQSLFVANYPAAIAESLTQPAIVYTKKTDSKLVFRMQCTEKGRGRPLTYVMYYAYDQKTDQWSLFSENQ